MMDTPDRNGGHVGSEARAADLLTRIADVRVPERLAASEARLRTAGLVLPLVGLALIGVAWFQASGTAFVSEQIPYLISGAVAGLGIVVIGVGLYVRFSLASLLRFWLARLNAEHQAQTDRVVDALGRVEAAIHASSSEAAQVRTRPQRRPQPQPQPQPQPEPHGVERPR
jgi:hypothetical protein